MDDLRYIKQELTKIKNNEDSFLGIDGGKIDSKIWICGVEFGSLLKEMEDYYSNEKTVMHEEKEGFKIPYRINAGQFENSKYDLFLSEFVINLFNKENIKRNDYLKNYLYNSNSDIFKLNLYPLAKINTDWDKTIDDIFKITKEEYYGYIFNNRKRLFNKLIIKFMPKVIICSITKGTEDIFTNAFFNQNEWLSFKMEIVNCKIEDRGKSKTFIISVYKKNDLSLIMIPFFGMGNGNLNSHDDVIFMAKYLKENYLKKILN